MWSNSVQIVMTVLSNYELLIVAFSVIKKKAVLSAFALVDDLHCFSVMTSVNCSGPSQ